MNHNIHFYQKHQTNKQKNHKSKKEKETKEEKRISMAKRLKNKFAAARVKIFLVTRISRNKGSFFWPKALIIKLTENEIIIPKVWS